MKKIEAKGYALGEMTEKQVREFIEWYREASRTMSFDTQILGYPRCAMLTAEDEDRATAYLPVQMVLMAEAFIPRPGLSNMRKAFSLWRLDEALRALAAADNVGDVYMYTQDDAYAARVLAHGWEEIPKIRLFKRRSGVSVKKDGSE